MTEELNGESNQTRFARKLALALSSANRNQTWLARKLGVSQSTVSAWCRGRLLPRSEPMVARIEFVLIEQKATIQPNDLISCWTADRQSRPLSAKVVEKMYILARGEWAFERSPVPKNSKDLKVFLCHSSDDKPAIRSLYRRLRADGIQPWLDEIDILPGQDWDLEIRKAIRDCHVVLVCLSKAAVSKTGYIQKEIRHVLDVADEQPEGTIFLIPVRLEQCDVPDRLRRWQWLDLGDRNGYERLMLALENRAGRV